MSPAVTDPPEIAAELIHNMLDQHYRQCLDEPIPALDNKPPRPCRRLNYRCNRAPSSQLA